MAASEPEKVEIGKYFTAKPGDVLVSAKVYDIDRVKVEGSYHAHIDRFEQQIEPGTELQSVLVPEKARELTGLQSSRYYCGEDLRVRSQFAAAMVGDMFSKWESVVRFCFVDEDADGKLEHMIIAGAKDKERLKAVSIDPLPYNRSMIVPDHSASEIRIVFKQLDAVTGKLQLEVQLWRDGKRQLFDYLLSGQMRNGSFSPPNNLYPKFKNDPKKLDYPMHFSDIMGANIGVRSVDKEKQQAEFVINRPIGPALFKPVSIQYQVIYIYM